MKIEKSEIKKLMRLKALDGILTTLPQEHVLYNPCLKSIHIENSLAHDNKHYLNVCGILHQTAQAVIIYRPAFNVNIAFEQKSYPILNLMLLSFIGQTLFNREDVATFWVDHFYPLFDAGRDLNTDIKIFDGVQIKKYFSITGKRIIFKPEYVSLNWHFALLYALYVLDPALVSVNYAEAFSFFKDTLFKIKKSDAQLRNRVSV